MRIKVNNFSRISYEETYGYFSLGSIWMENCDPMGSWIYINSYECKCLIDGEEFKTLLCKIGLSDEYLVLSDFSKIPDLAVINNEEVLKEIKSSFMEFIRETSVGGVNPIHQGLNGEYFNGYSRYSPVVVPYGLADIPTTYIEGQNSASVRITSYDTTNYLTSSTPTAG